MASQTTRVLPGEKAFPLRLAHGLSGLASQYTPDLGLRSEASSSDERRYLVVHRVVCEGSENREQSHLEHDEAKDFLDLPRMFVGDSRASSLRGKLTLGDLEDFWFDNPQIQFVVIREYSCLDYHSQINTCFEITASGADRHLLNKFRSRFSKLRADGPSPKMRSEHILIHDEFSEAISSFVSKHEPSLGHWNSETCLRDPYDYFYHFRRPLREMFRRLSESVFTHELELLLDYIEGAYHDLFEQTDEVLAAGRLPRAVFPKLFVVNDIVIVNREDQPRALVIEALRPLQTSGHIALDCWSWTFDGSFRKTSETIRVQWPASNPEEMLVTNLPVWPLRLDKSGLRRRLLDRGMVFWSCRHRRLINYESPIPSIFELQITNPKYMIDYHTYRQMYPSKFSYALASASEMMEHGIDMLSEQPPSDLFAILLPSTIYGYAFHDKKWRSLSVEHVGAVHWNRDTFNEHLVLKATKKEIIKALVQVHLKTVQDVDVVDNKGNGVIILLHGSPGTGKTLTAESVAELAEKPLYRVTCGDIGTDATSVEKYMESVLLLGTIWKCVVLLEEADIFLEERQVTDLARNALVSVFLRVLEYYDGILILTTNRVGTFDEAFKSRIQLAIHYPPLDLDGRHSIWVNFINILKEKKVDMNYKELQQKAIVFAHKPFNGRQIRNNLWRAAQVAKYRNEKLNSSHLEQVLEISEEFEKYVVDTRGLTDEEYAQSQRVRSS